MAKKSVNETVKELISNGHLTCPETPQGVTKERITSVLRKLARLSEETRDVVFALLDESPSWYSKAPAGARFCDGACTAHIGAHIAILQRDSDAKLDREGRDYWIKPLVDIGAIEPCYLPSSTDAALLEHGNQFYNGHLKAKSPNNAYRLAHSFVEILKSDEGSYEDMLVLWISQDAVRERLELQATLAEAVRHLADHGHSDLIQACCDHYVPRFLPGYMIVYVDDGDGDRVTVEQQDILMAAGLAITNHDSMPDVLLWNETNDSLWVIEAVTSDGEVDNHKVHKMTEFATRHGKPAIGFTTAYPTWKKTAERQKATNNNLAIGSYFWIMEDASKNFKVDG